MSVFCLVSGARVRVKRDVGSKSREWREWRERGDWLRLRHREREGGQGPVSVSPEPEPGDDDILNKIPGRQQSSPLVPGINMVNSVM